MGDCVADFRYSFFGSIVSDVSDRKLIIAKRGTARLLDNDNRDIPPINIGGLSGSPAYIRKVGGSFELAGFVQMGAMSNSDIFLTHATFVNRDGTLQH
jgi:hypothetical protein